MEEVLTVPLLDSHAGDDGIGGDWELQVSMLKSGCLKLSRIGRQS